MKIRLDRTVCDGFGLCAKHAPGYFSLDDWGYASLTNDGTVADEDHDAVMSARRIGTAQHCFCSSVPKDSSDAAMMPTPWGLKQ